MKCFICFLTFILFLTLIVFTFVECKISDKRLCVDPSCSVPVSEAKTLLLYNSDDSQILSFMPNQQVKIFSKSAGDRSDLWGAEINGKRGYVPKGLVRESKIYNKPTIIVPTERAETENIVNDTLPIIETSQNEVKVMLNDLKGSFGLSGVSADSVPPDIQPQQANFQVLDGTTIYDELSDPTESVPQEISDTSSETPPLKLDLSSKKESVDDIVKVEETLTVPDDTGKESNSDQIEVAPVENQIKVDESISANLQEITSDESKTLKVEDKVKRVAKKQSAEKGLLAKFGETLFSGLVDDDDEEEEEEDEDEDEEIAESVIDAKDSVLEQERAEEKDSSPVLEMSPTLGLGDLKPEPVSLKTGEPVEQKVEELVDQKEKPEKLDQTIKSKELDEQTIIHEGQAQQKIVEDHKSSSTIPEPSDTPKPIDSILTATEQLKSAGETIKSPQDLDMQSIKPEEQVEQKIVEEPQVNSVTPEHIDSILIITEQPKIAEETIKPKELDVQTTKPEEQVEQKIIEEQQSNSATPEHIDNTSTAEQPKILEETMKTEERVEQKIVVEPQINSALHEPTATPELIDSISTTSEQPKIIGETKHAEDSVESIKEEERNEGEQEMVQPLKEDSPPSDSQSKAANQNEPSIPEMFDTVGSLLSNNTENVLPVSTVETTISNENNSTLHVANTNLEPSDLLKTGDLSSSTIEKSQSSEIKKSNSYDQEMVPNSSVEKTTDASILTEDVPSIIEKPEPSSAITSEESSLLILDSPQSLMLNNEIKDQHIFSTEAPHTDSNNDGSTLPPEIVLDSIDQLKDIDVSEQKTEVKSEVSGNVDSNFSEHTEFREQPEVSSTDESEGGFAGVVEEVTEEAVKDGFGDVVVTSEMSSEGIFSWFSSLFSGSEVPASVEKVSDTVTSHPEDGSNILISHPEEVSNVVTSHPDEQTDEMWIHRTHIRDSQEDSCTLLGLGEDSCAKMDPVEKSKVWTSSKSSNADFVMMSAISMMDKVPVELTLLLVVTSLAVLIFTLGYYYIEAHRRDGSLVARINNLERDLLVKKKENAILEDAFSNAQFEVKGRDSDLCEVKETNEELLLELEELKAVRLDLEDQITSLERELETVTESGLEMHRLLSDSLSSQDGSQVLLQTVESLREKLDKQNVQIVQLNQSLGEKNEEIELLQDQVSAAENEKKALDDRLTSLKREKEEEELDIKEKNRALTVQLEEIIETKALEESRMSTEMSKLRITLEEIQRKLVEREAEVEAMKDSIRQLRATDQEESLQELYDVVAVSAKLTTAVAERDEFKEKFIEEEGARKLLEDHVRVISREVAELKENFETAEKEKIEALTKLKVLSNYFKEKETELQKELGTQESMWLQKQGDDHTIYEQMRSLREENDKYKLQNESLKKEICEQESSFKIQLANVEQKAHENWVASRQAERRLKEVQQEATQLRNRLTLSEKNAANHDDPKQKINETNGDPSSPPPSLMFSPTTSPPFMMYHNMGPIPPGDFIPPPPLISPFSPDSRPPPLGRISSPPLDPRFSPPPPPMPFIPYDYSFGHHSPSPPLPQPHHRTVHKPQPREAGRDIKDTVTSNYSSETTDKPSRRSKR